MPDESPRGAWWTPFCVVASCLGAAVAAWLLPASVHIVSWTSEPSRIALLASLSGLWLALTLGAAVAAVTLFAGSGARVRRLRHARILAPLSVLWAWTVPYWPWLPDHAPGLLILAGPARWLVTAVAFGGVLGAWMQDRPWGSGVLARPHRRAIFLVTLALFAGLGLRSLATVGLGGDEPHYLIITHSLLVDRDLRIENNHANRDYREFFGGELRPDYLRRGRDGEIYSIHSPGLPALLLPGYAVAGPPGAVVTMCLLGALAALAVYDAALLLGGAEPALLTWAAVCLTVPFLPHSWMIYPETAAAAVVAWAVLWLVNPPSERLSTWIWRWICLAALPWLHTKFVVFLVILVLCQVWRLRAKVKALIAFTTPVAIASICWLGLFFLIYGSFDPQVPYGAYTQQFVRFVNVPRGLLGLLLDQKFGLLMYSPIYLAAAVGIWLVFREPQWRTFGLAALAATVAYVISSTRLYMWWGGSSAPARFLVPVLPLLGPAMTLSFARLHGRVARATMGVWLALSLIVAAAGVIFPERALLFSAPHGVARLLELVEGSAPISATLPTFTEEDWVQPSVRLMPWIAAVVAALGLAVLVAIRARRLGAYGIALVEVAGFIGLASLLTVPGAASTRAETAVRGRVDLMRAYDPERVEAFDYRTTRSLDPADVLRAGTLSVERPPGSIVPRSRRPGVRALEPIGNHSNAYIFYINDDTYPEGGVFWTRAGWRGDVLVATGGLSEIAFTLHIGPAAGTVKLSVAGRRLDTEMQPNETREVTASVPAGFDLVPVSVQAPGWFRPSEVDPKSTDRRALGCQVRINVQ